jgi:aldose sugar dehydrogenase
MSTLPLPRMLAGLILACWGLATPAVLFAQTVFQVEEIARFNEPWAFAFLPDGKMLVTEKAGAMKLFAIGGSAMDVGGIPAVRYGGQGGLGDVVLHPQFASNNLVYFSYAEPGSGDTAGAAVARATLIVTDQGARLEDLQVLWRQIPKVSSRGHFAHRIAFDAEGYLWISSGERQQFDPAQDMQSNLGKIIRLRDDGALPQDNPFQDDGMVAREVWSLGHRNPLGIAFDAYGQLWNVEMGPAGGDELNRVTRGANYGYPTVSDGDHYDGRPIPGHDTRPEFNTPAIVWTPVISPSSLMFYSGSEFPAWHGNAFIGGLSSMSLVRVEFDGTQAREAERFEMGQRIRGVRQGPDGAIWIIEDERAGSGGRLLRLSNPANQDH